MTAVFLSTQGSLGKVGLHCHNIYDSSSLTQQTNKDTGAAGVARPSKNCLGVNGNSSKHVSGGSPRYLTIC